MEDDLIWNSVILINIVQSGRNRSWNFQWWMLIDFLRENVFSVYLSNKLNYYFNYSWYNSWTLYLYFAQAGKNITVAGQTRICFQLVTSRSLYNMFTEYIDRKKNISALIKMSLVTLATPTWKALPQWRVVHSVRSRKDQEDQGHLCEYWLISLFRKNNCYIVLIG